MPTTGTMTVVRQNTSLPGHSGYNTIEITYNFSPGQDVSDRSYDTMNGCVRVIGSVTCCSGTSLFQPSEMKIPIPLYYNT